MRKLAVAVLALALLLVGTLLPLVRPLRCPVNRAAFERIKVGMTRAEVEAILGGPPARSASWPPALVEVCAGDGPRRGEADEEDGQGVAVAYPAL